MSEPNICGEIDIQTGIRCDQKKDNHQDHSSWKRIRYAWTVGCVQNMSADHIHQFCPCSICNRQDVIKEGIVICWVDYCTEPKKALPDDNFDDPNEVPLGQNLSGFDTIEDDEETTKCEICGKTPCSPWSNKHDDDFQKEIDEKAHTYCKYCGDFVHEGIVCTEEDEEEDRQ